MVPKIQQRGTSFKGLATYLTHDPEADTERRVAWTHTLNLPHDDVLSAVDTMVWTSRNAELLKQEAGIRAGGRSTESPVKHFSLNWAVEDDPSREHMINTTEDFMRHMNWHEHQALLVAHNDKEYAHVHVMLNAVHPETGLCLNDGFDHRRAQAWALGYERDQGRIHCEQRLLDPEQREDAPTRPAWMAMKEREQEFARQEKSRRDNEAIILENQKNIKIEPSDDFKILKEIQKRERIGFFNEGKLVFAETRRTVYREVREEFRDEWSDYYALQKQGGDPYELTDAKLSLIARQKEALETRCDEAYAVLRHSRDATYQELLDNQRDARHGLRARREAGLDNGLFLDLAEHKVPARPMTTSFHEEAERATARPHEFVREGSRGAPVGHPRSGRDGMKSGAAVGGDIGFGIISLFASLADGVVGTPPDPRPRYEENNDRRSSPFEAVIEDAHNRQQREQAEADEEARKRQRSYGE